MASILSLCVVSIGVHKDVEVDLTRNLASSELATPPSRPGPYMFF